MTLILLILAGIAAFAAWRFGIIGMIARTLRGVVNFAVRCALVAAGLAVGWAMFGPAGLALAAVAMFGLWWVSLHLKEWSDCPGCGGSAKHRGMYARSSFSHCGRCEGTKGQVVRPGVRIMRPTRARELLASAGVDRPMWRG